jgi:hypothetical protein
MSLNGTNPVWFPNIVVYPDIAAKAPVRPKPAPITSRAMPAVLSFIIQRPPACG